eukprot:8746707-Pyramimonas_sp.AAC.1
MFNLPQARDGGSALRCATWNARALLQYHGAKAIPKLRYLQQIHLQSTVLAMQEVHADRVQLE